MISFTYDICWCRTDVQDPSTSTMGELWVARRDDIVMFRHPVLTPKAGSISCIVQSVTRLVFRLICHRLAVCGFLTNASSKVICGRGGLSLMDKQRTYREKPPKRLFPNNGSARRRHALSTSNVRVTHIHSDQLHGTPGLHGPSGIKNSPSIAEMLRVCNSSYTMVAN